MNMIMTDIEYFLATFGLQEQDILLFPYGSRVYGTAKEDSDHDYLAVIPANHKVNTGEEYVHGSLNVHIFNRQDWEDQLQSHKVHCLEAYYLPDGVCQKHFPFTINLVKLRHELSEKSSKSWVKAKKKIDVEKDFYIGWKSLFHSLRILNFGIQIVTLGGIKDYSAANHYWAAILGAKEYTWDYFKRQYQGEFNRLATEFRKFAPKK